MHITTINRVFPHFMRLQSKIYHQTMHHPPTAFAVLFVTSTCFSGIILFSLLAFTEFFNRRVPEYERIFFDQILVTRKCKASTRTEESECAICLGAFEQADRVSKSTSCLHEFHTACYKQWLVTHPSCPYCRKDVLFKAASGRNTHQLYCPAI
eukprot:scaffold4802_cov267-Chaetoceros_neogracile.AAC.7